MSFAASVQLQALPAGTSVRPLPILWCRLRAPRGGGGVTPVRMSDLRVRWRPFVGEYRRVLHSKAIVQTVLPACRVCFTEGAPNKMHHSTPKSWTHGMPFQRMQAKFLVPDLFLSSAKPCDDAGFLWSLFVHTGEVSSCNQMIAQALCC